jgi:hypothetical protein
MTPNERWPLLQVYVAQTFKAVNGLRHGYAQLILWRSQAKACHREASGGMH